MANDPLTCAERGIAGDRSSSCEHKRGAHRVLSVCLVRRQRNRHDAHDHRDREDKPDLAGIESLGGEPDRQKWQLHAEDDEKRRVKTRQPSSKGSGYGGLSNIGPAAPVPFPSVMEGGSPNLYMRHHGRASCRTFQG